MGDAGNGTLRLQDGTWLIEARPHVILRAKRVFASTSRQTAVLRLSDTDQNARELVWFLARYPLEIPKLTDRARLYHRAKSHREREDEVQRLLGGHHAPIGAWSLAVPPRDYQLRGAELAIATRGLLIADDVGLGKTATAICTFTDPRTLPAVVVTLTHLPRQWHDEIKRFAPRLRVHIVKGTRPYDLRIRRAKYTANGWEDSLPDVILLSYSKLFGWAEVLGSIAKSVVFDECQELRIAQTQQGATPKKYAAARHIAERAEFRLGLSATPIYNFGDEIHSVMNVLAPNRLGTRREFMEEWGAQEKRLADPAAFGTYARSSGLMLRRTRADVGRELPPVQRIPQYVETDTKALDDVAASVAELARVILASGEAKRGDKMHASEEISWKLRQATGIGKAPHVADFVRLLLESGERKVVLYGWHREVYKIWQSALEDLCPVMYTGSESVPQKDEAKRAFIEKDHHRVMILSLRAGAGLDGLQNVTRTVVFGELDWSPGVHTQCIGRVARDGQRDPVAAYFLISDHGADPVMADVLELKEQQAAGVADPSAPLVEQIQVDPHRIRKLALDYLKRRGLPVPAAAPLKLDAVAT